jgi:hypothetical protein
LQIDGIATPGSASGRERHQRGSHFRNIVRDADYWHTSCAELVRRLTGL